MAAGLAGCAVPNPLDASSTLAPGEPVLVLDLPVHVVAVGFSEFDAAALASQLRHPLPTFKMIRLDTTADGTPEPLQYAVDYRVHAAPEAFARELAAFAATTGTVEPAERWLESYDRAGPGRFCEPGPLAALPVAPPVAVPGALAPVTSPACAEVDVLDARAVEAWIAANRARHGLEFEGAGYTVFVFDSFTNGHLPQDRYHRYAIEDGSTDPSIRTMRGWGGDHDFVYWDVGAAPSAVDYRPWGNYTGEEYVPDPDLAARVDGPVWDFADDMPTFYANLAQNVFDATRMLWARSPIYPFEYAEKYVLPFYVFIDPNAHANPDSPLSAFRASDFEANTWPDVVQKAFEDLVPWADVEVTFEFRYLPDDDPGMQAALADAKSRGSAQAVDFGIVKKHVIENWDSYVPDVPGARVYPSFGFVLDAPSSSLYAFADGDHLGNSFGVFLNVADAFLPCGTRGICFTEDVFGDPESWWAWWNGVLIHEIGHSFGLTHPHDTSGRDERGLSTYEANWLLDSTSSIMTYRHSLTQFSQFDKDLVLRANAVNVAKEILEDPSSPRAARRGATEALDLLRAGDYAGGFERARAALRAEDEGALRAAAVVLKGDVDLGVPGEAVTTLVEIPAGRSPVGQPPSAPAALPVPVGRPWLDEGTASATVPIEIPEGARAVLIEYREADAPSHRGWSSSLRVENAAGEYVIGLGESGYDRAVLLNLAYCEGGCVARVISVSGVRTAYEVTVTPYLA